MATLSRGKEKRKRKKTSKAQRTHIGTFDLLHAYAFTQRTKRKVVEDI